MFELGSVYLISIRRFDFFNQLLHRNYILKKSHVRDKEYYLSIFLFAIRAAVELYIYGSCYY